MNRRNKKIRNEPTPQAEKTRFLTQKTTILAADRTIAGAKRTHAAGNSRCRQTACPLLMNNLPAPIRCNRLRLWQRFRK